MSYGGVHVGGDEVPCCHECGSIAVEMDVHDHWHRMVAGLLVSEPAPVSVDPADVDEVRHAAGEPFFTACGVEPVPIDSAVTAWVPEPSRLAQVTCPDCLRVAALHFAPSEPENPEPVSVEPADTDELVVAEEVEDLLSDVGGSFDLNRVPGQQAAAKAIVAHIVARVKQDCGHERFEGLEQWFTCDKWPGPHDPRAHPSMGSCVSPRRLFVGPVEDQEDDSE